MANELNKVLDSNEKVLWEEGPQFWPFFFSSFILIALGLIFFIIGGIVVIGGIASGNWWFLLLPHFWIGFAFVIGIPAYTALVHKHTYYAITNKRTIIQTGLIGRDFTFLDHDQLTNAEVNVGIFDKMFGQNSGSILLSSAGTFVQGKHGPVSKPYALANVTGPYAVFKFFKKVSHDVKTDVSYPNKLRPSNNPGYKTKYSA